MLAKLSKKYNHAVIPSCCEQGCTLKLQGLRNYVILKGEKITSTEKICDCLIFHKKRILDVVLVELKSNSIDTNSIIEKFCNATKHALQICSELSINTEIRMYLILLSKHYRSASAYAVLRDQQIKILGKMHKIRLKRCGASFVQIIEQSN